MQAIVAHAAKDIRIEECTIAPPETDEVQIRIEKGGICGSDLHYYQHGGFGQVRLREPMILGHEVSGRIVSLGANVANLQVGQLVAVSPSRPCNSCQYCVRAQHNHCLNMRFYGSAMPFPHIQGAFREEINVHHSQCAVADGLTSAEAAMAEPLAVSVHAAAQAGNLLGKRVLITGSGPIGLLCLLVARAAGATEIVTTDIAAFPLASATSLGASAVVNSLSDGSSAFQAWSENKGHFDVLFECTGVAAALAQAIPAIKAGGTIVQVGLGGDMELPMQQITVKELSLRGSFRFHEEFFTAVALMQSKQVDVNPLITKTVSLADAQNAFDLATDRSQSLKVHIAF